MQGLKQMRKERGLTQNEISKALNITQQGYSRIESGKAFPRKGTLDKLCKFFDCKVDDLL